MLRLFDLAALAISLLYPLAIWLGEGRFEPRLLALLLVLVVLARLQSLRVRAVVMLWLGGTVLLLALAVWSNGMLPLKLYPVIVNLSLLGVFAHSLISPPSIIERIARAREPNLPAPAVGYARSVTQVWCVFFAVNGAVALVTAVWTSPQIWWFYNGLVAYVLMATLFAGEYCVRRHVRSGQNV